MMSQTATFEQLT